MSAADETIKAVRRALWKSEDLDTTEKEALDRELGKAIAKEGLPTIAIIGETGVGKTTTLNALFNAGAEIGHSTPTTKSPNGVTAEIRDHHGNKGDVRILDLPGLGESIERAAALADLYAQVLPQADVILWVHPIHDRMLEFTQRKVVEIFRDQLAPLSSNLVFGLNKADGIFPNNWRYHANVPSEEQFRHLNRAEEHFAMTIREVLPKRNLPNVTTYSALRRFNLPRLFALLMEAMPKKRRWLLERNQSGVAAI